MGIDRLGQHFRLVNNAVVDRLRDASLRQNDGRPCAAVTDIPDNRTAFDHGADFPRRRARAIDDNLDAGFGLVCITEHVLKHFRSLAAPVYDNDFIHGSARFAANDRQQAKRAERCQKATAAEPSFFVMMGGNLH